MEGDSEGYLRVLEDNHWVMVKAVDPEVFLDYMQQHRVLSEEDCQVVQNYFINQSRRARMRCFLNIVRSKGPDSIKLFFQQLGWEYPHVFREIFRQEPSVAPLTYKQDSKSRLSCNLNQLLTFGMDIKRLQSQKQDLVEQIKDMEAMLKHQRNEIEDLERENQRLRQYERENQQNKEKLCTLTTKNEEIKEENRQFLHEIRTLTLELHKRRDQESSLQAKLDEMTQQIQEKSFELSRKNREESDLRAKYEHMRTESIKLQSQSQIRSRQHGFAAQVIKAQQAALQSDMQHQVEILTDDIKSLEETNSGLCEQLQYMQNLLDEEKEERDQLHRRKCALELDKNTLETRQVTSAQKIERYYNRIKQLEDEKRKLEEERMHMQTKLWEMSQINDNQFEQQHKLENRYDQLQQSYEQFRQDHRYCLPSESFDRRPRERLPGIKEKSQLCHPCHLPGSSPPLGNDDPFKPFASYYAPEFRHGMLLTHHDDVSNQTGNVDGATQPVCVTNPVFQNRPIERSGSLTVNIPGSMKMKNKRADEDSTESDNGEASTVSELSSVSSCTFDPLDIAEICRAEQTALKGTAPQLASADTPTTGNFYVRSGVKEEGGVDQLPVEEGDILFVLQTGKEQWRVMGVDKFTGKLNHRVHGYITNPDSTTGKPVRQNLSESSGKPATLERKPAIRRGLLQQQSITPTFTTVYPMKATRLLPVLLLCPTSVLKLVLSCMEQTARDWAHIIYEWLSESASQLFTESDKHNVLPWEMRPKDPHKYSSNLHKFIIITITLQSQEALVTLRHLLGEPNLTMDFDQEMKHLKEVQDLVTHAGLHSETVKVVEGQNDREAFWKDFKDKVDTVQQRIFWLESLHLPR